MDNFFEENDNVIENDLQKRVIELKNVDDSIELLNEYKDSITSIVLAFKYNDPIELVGNVVLNHSGDKDVCYGLSRRLLNVLNNELTVYEGDM